MTDRSQRSEPHLRPAKPPLDDEIALRAQDAAGEAATSRITEPTKVIRIGHVLGALQRELHEGETAGLDRRRWIVALLRAREQLDGTLSGPLADELGVMVPPLSDEPTDGELRVAHAQLLGWVEGLLQGIHGAVAHSQAQLPADALGHGEDEEAGGQPGQYL